MSLRHTIPGDRKDAKLAQPAILCRSATFRVISVVMTTPDRPAGFLSRRGTSMSAGRYLRGSGLAVLCPPPPRLLAIAISAAGWLSLWFDPAEHFPATAPRLRGLRAQPPYLRRNLSRHRYCCAARRQSSVSQGPTRGRSDQAFRLPRTLPYQICSTPGCLDAHPGWRGPELSPLQAPIHPAGNLSLPIHDDRVPKRGVAGGPPRSPAGAGPVSWR